MNYFETHCHLDFPNFNKDREQVISNSRNAGVNKFINVGIDTVSCEKSIALAERHDDFYASVGYHPNYADIFDSKAFNSFLQHPKVVAVGEIGLDYYRKHTAKELQQKVFTEQLELAEEKQLPVIIHNRQANHDCWQILSRFNIDNLVFHCYAGDLCFAEKLWSRGWHISVTGTITYKNCSILDVVKKCPSDRLMTETDSPFLSPQNNRGKRNDPTAIPVITARIAEIRNEAVEDLSQTLFNNACRFFLKKT